MSVERVGVDDFNTVESRLPLEELDPEPVLVEPEPGVDEPADYYAQNGAPPDDAEPTWDDLEWQRSPAESESALVDGAALRIVTLEDFVAVEEPGDAPILGDGAEALIGEDSDVMLYGDGGVGKTTLAIDLGFHLAAGDDWLGIPVARPTCALVVENEGPRALFRPKLRAKREAWQGSPVESRLLLLEEPWAQFTFADAGQREALATAICAHEVDVVIVGPVAASGMEDAGTLQEVRAFARLLAKVRELAGRRVTFVLVHHEAKGGKVSGAWEGCGDTLLHVQGEGHGRTRLHVQKARWASSRHATTLHLVWTDGEGFAVTDADAREVQRQAEVAAAREWIVAYVTEHPGQARGKVEDAYAATAGARGARARAREAIDGELEMLAESGSEHRKQTARPPALATTIGETRHGTYLIPFSDAVSPLAEPLFGECGANEPDPEAGGVLAVSPTTLRVGETNGESTDGAPQASDPGLVDSHVSVDENAPREPTRPSPAEPSDSAADAAREVIS